MFRLLPNEVYMTHIDSWRELPGGNVEFSIRRLTVPYED
jgi:hypothetical protein